MIYKCKIDVQQDLFKNSGAEINFFRTLSFLPGRFQDQRCKPALKKIEE